MHDSENKRQKIDSNHADSANKSKKPSECVICADGSAHYALYCPKFNAVALKERHEAVRRHALCYNCLSPAHTVFSCTARTCKHCNKHHHTMLCYQKATSNANAAQLNPKDATKTEKTGKKKGPRKSKAKQPKPEP